MIFMCSKIHVYGSELAVFKPFGDMSRRRDNLVEEARQKCAVCDLRTGQQIKGGRGNMFSLGHVHVYVIKISYRKRTSDRRKNVLSLRGVDSLLMI